MRWDGETVETRERSGCRIVGEHSGGQRGRQCVLVRSSQLEGRAKEREKGQTYELRPIPV